MPQPRQPFLHDLVCTLASPTQAWSDRTGDIGGGGLAIGAQGVLHGDVRMLSSVELLADDRRPVHLATFEQGERTTFTYAFRDATSMSGHPDALILIDRVRTIEPGSCSETLRVESMAPQPLQFELAVRLAHDLAPVEQIKTGTPSEPLAFAEEMPLSWGNDDVSATLTAGDGQVRVAPDKTTAQLSWPIMLAPGTVETRDWSVKIEDESGVVVAPIGAKLWVDEAVDRLVGPQRTSGDQRLTAWLRRSLDDLNGLRMATRDQPDNPFFAAGAPWYLTLFGRDSLWTARMLLSVDPAPAIGTLRTLARLAGSTVDPDSGQEPGKIPHELRRGTFAFGDTSLPPLYYGTIDATALWICLLHDLWGSGGQDDVVAELLDPLTAALQWILTFGDADGDGFLEYIDTSGHGLANQGWKDSADSVRFADGSIADGPVALCEVQGYAYEAACAGADLLDAFGRPGAADFRGWAATLADRFRAQFWCGVGDDRYPALALDGRKRRVDSLTSNIGHLLGTGLLSPDEELLVARRVAGPELDSGLGLRTMSASDGGYHPLSYHCGSVWPHDTAIVIAGLERAGLLRHARGLVDGLLRASVRFGQRLPELWSGEGRAVPYPAACRPQAWSAAAAVMVADAMRT